eukprot:TRINITY_DN8362_c0_g1_i1.p1 TRINITY_DN8362_c0_g1~~TRINITY_DN8362_c0_g1_i1.p1  ORF type:complete len:681 (-),score=152.93 TRINITY_DN8362_c0_g1_i1:431-2473(-)
MSGRAIVTGSSPKSSPFGGRMKRDSVAVMAMRREHREKTGDVAAIAAVAASVRESTEEVASEPGSGGTEEEGEEQDAVGGAPVQRFTLDVNKVKLRSMVDEFLEAYPHLQKEEEDENDIPTRIGRQEDVPHPTASYLELEELDNDDDELIYKHFFGAGVSARCHPLANRLRFNTKNLDHWTYRVDAMIQRRKKAAKIADSKSESQGKVAKLVSEKAVTPSGGTTVRGGGFGAAKATRGPELPPTPSGAGKKAKPVSQGSKEPKRPWLKIQTEPRARSSAPSYRELAAALTDECLGLDHHGEPIPEDEDSDAEFADDRAQVRNLLAGKLEYPCVSPSPPPEHLPTGWLYAHKRPISRASADSCVSTAVPGTRQVTESPMLPAASDSDSRCDSRSDMCSPLPPSECRSGYTPPPQADLRSYMASPPPISEEGRSDVASPPPILENSLEEYLAAADSSALEADGLLDVPFASLPETGRPQSHRRVNNAAVVRTPPESPAGPQSVQPSRPETASWRNAVTDDIPMLSMKRAVYVDAILERQRQHLRRVDWKKAKWRKRRERMKESLDGGDSFEEPAQEAQFEHMWSQPGARRGGQLQKKPPYLTREGEAALRGRNVVETVRELKKQMQEAMLAPTQPYDCGLVAEMMEYRLQYDDRPGVAQRTEQRSQTRSQPGSSAVSSVNKS